MDRAGFEQLRDLPDKVIRGDIRLSHRQATSPALTVDAIAIENAQGVPLRLNITYNPQTGAKTFNVHIPGTGPICRLDVDGTMHRPAGRSHKHSLQTMRCPDRNLPDNVIDRPDLAGKSVIEAFQEFCSMAKITHEGTFELPPGGF